MAIIGRLEDVSLTPGLLSVEAPEVTTLVKFCFVLENRCAIRHDSTCLAHLNHLIIDCNVSIGLESNSHVNYLSCRGRANYKEIDFSDRISYILLLAVIKDRKIAMLFANNSVGSTVPNLDTS